MKQPTKHILLSSMGASGPKDTTYVFNGDEQSSCFSAFGLWKLLPQDSRPDEIWFLLTPQAREVAWEAVQREAKKLSVSVASIDLLGNAADDTRQFLELTSNEIPANCRLTLNITEGLRHHAFLFYALALYLAEFRGISIAGAWYCRRETENHDDPKPVIDLKPVLDLAHWFHALAAFRETGSLRQISGLVSDSKTQDRMNELSDFFLTGMPIEAGRAATQILKQSAPLLPELPLRDKIEKLIRDEVNPLAGAVFEDNSTQFPAKKQVPLTEQELSRQAEFISRYFATGQKNLAFGLMREWLVNLVALQRGDSDSWLDRRSREKIERELGGLDIVHRGKKDHPQVRELLSEMQCEWAKRWSRVTETRNLLQHHGMKAAEFHPDNKGIRKAEEDWGGWKDWASLDSVGGGQGRLLICPIGLTPGVLYSALCKVRPARAIVVCSEASAPAIDEAISKATDESDGGVSVLRLQMTDPHIGIKQFDELLQAASVWLFEADEVYANLTGGTTLMGVLVGELVKRSSREYQRKVREFVLIDKRPFDQQQNDPWCLGEIHYLDEEANDDKKDSGNPTSESEKETT